MDRSMQRFGVGLLDPLTPVKRSVNPTWYLRQQPWPRPLPTPLRWTGLMFSWLSGFKIWWKSWNQMTLFWNQIQLFSGGKFGCPHTFGHIVYFSIVWKFFFNFFFLKSKLKGVIVFKTLWRDRKLTPRHWSLTSLSELVEVADAC